MRTNNLFRSVLAIGAVLAVAGPGLVLAGDGGPTYVPTIIQVLGPSSVETGTTGEYDARVFFSNGTSVVFYGAPDVTFSAARGSITGSGLYTAPATDGRDRISATFTSGGVTVTGARIIQNP
jgi:hypothetical protein